MIFFPIFFCSRRQHQSNTTWHGTTLSTPQQQPTNNLQQQNVTPTTPTTNERLLKGTTCDLFELLEKAQSSRLDDQRCVLPAYFNQVSLEF